MTVRLKKISESRYKKLVGMGKRAYGCMINEAPMTLRCMRIFDARPVEKDGEFFIEYTIGD